MVAMTLFIMTRTLMELPVNDESDLATKMRKSIEGT